MINDANKVSNGFKAVSKPSATILNHLDDAARDQLLASEFTLAAIDYVRDVFSATLSTGVTLSFAMADMTEDDLTEMLHCALNQKIVFGEHLTRIYRTAKQRCRTGWSPQFSVDSLMLMYNNPRYVAAYTKSHDVLAALRKVTRTSRAAGFSAMMQKVIDSPIFGEYFDLMDPAISNFARNTHTGPVRERKMPLHARL